MLKPIERRLLDPAQTAEKLGYSKNWLVEHRTRLEQMGFPKPILGGGHGSPMRWDNYAIDLWLDSKLPSHLRGMAPSKRDETRMASVNQFNLEHHLSERARGLTL